MSEDLDVIGHDWRHLKSGGTYSVIGTCQLEATNEPAFLYRSHHDGTVWARSKSEFLDGRFAHIRRSVPVPQAARIAALEAEIETLSAAHRAMAQQLATAGEALKPFAQLGDIMLPLDPTDNSVWVKEVDETPVNNISFFGFTFKHFRDAARALNEIRPSDSGE